jgi:transcription elongation factor Elf1
MNDFPKKNFQRRVEDFECLNCGHKIEGNGYTNHCPNCLWSRHVDINPGDRLAECRGMMEAIAIHKKGQQYRIFHRCEICGHEAWNQSAHEDNFDRLIAIAKSMGNA